MPAIHELLAMLSAALFGGLISILTIRSLWLQFRHSRYRAAGGQLSFRAWSHYRPPAPLREPEPVSPELEPYREALESPELLIQF